MRPLHLFISSLALVLAGCSLAVSPDPQKASTCRLQAEEAIVQKQYADAAGLLAKAASYAPDDGRLRLRHGEVLERQGRFREAGRTYERGLERVAPSPERQELAWRLALLRALRLQDREWARALLPELAAGTPAQADLEGVLALQAGDPRAALQRFNLALAGATTNDAKATAYYHAALAYRQLGEEKNTFGSLYHAVNHAEHLGLLGEIERLWHDLNGDGPAQ